MPIIKPHVFTQEVVAGVMLYGLDTIYPDERNNCQIVERYKIWLLNSQIKWLNYPMNSKSRI